MIKFNCLIHKETGTAIKYEDWKETLLESKYNSVFIKTDKGNFEYRPKEMLFSDDFEIIYDSEFINDELKTIWCNADSVIDKYPHTKCESEKLLKDKVLKESDKREKLKDKYGIEV